MNNQQIAKVFLDIADLLERRKENWFKIRAYRKAAGSIEELTVEVEQLVAEDRLKEIPGVGEAINRKITELVLPASWNTWRGSRPRSWRRVSDRT